MHSTVSMCVGQTKKRKNMHVYFYCFDPCKIILSLVGVVSCTAVVVANDVIAAVVRATGVVGTHVSRHKRASSDWK